MGDLRALPPTPAAALAQAHALARLAEARALAEQAAGLLEGLDGRAIPAKHAADVEWAVLGLQAAANRCRQLAAAIARERGGG